MRTLARSGASTDGRLGFKELVAEVGLGHVGLILAFEVSRLARNIGGLASAAGSVRADRHADRRRRRHLLARATSTTGCCSGLKGTMAEAELHLIRARLDGGLRNKAARGELRLRAAGRPGPRRGRPDRAVPRRAGPARDRARVRAVAAARVGAAGRDGADRARASGCRAARSGSGGSGGRARAMGRCTTS